MDPLRASPMQKITPFLWFDRNAEEAAEFYVSAFKGSKIVGKTRYNEASSKASGLPAGTVLTVDFKLGGQDFSALNGGPAFKFSPATSFFVWCASEKEISQMWKKLSEGGTVRIELGKYPFAEKYGWCEDRFGVNWQLMLHENRQKITPALLFVRKHAGMSEEAMRFYTSIFKDSGIDSVNRDEKTKVNLHARFRLAGQDFVAFESPIEHPFDFTEAVSFVINCDDQKEIDYFWDKLKEGGDPAARQCGWLKDRFGVSWQVVPAALGKMLMDKDPKRSSRVLDAMMPMKKLDLKALKDAYKG